MSTASPDQDAARPPDPALPPAFRVGFYLVPAFPMLAFAAAVEPLRAANRLSGRALYGWTLISRDGGGVPASNGIEVAADAAFAAAPPLDMLVVCAGLNAERFADRAVFAWLRRLARERAFVGGLSTGAYLLARAGLLDGRRCTVHWENVGSLAEAFPAATASDDIFVVDGRIFTCSGGTAALDMMLSFIAAQHGQALANAVSEQFIHPRIRGTDDKQRMHLQTRLGVSNARLLSAIALMESSVEEPLAVADLAARIGLSSRQLERLFARYLNTTPNRYALELRLLRGRALLLQTSQTVFEIAVACGFASASHFGKCYRRFFGRTPRDERRGAVVAARDMAGQDRAAAGAPMPDLSPAARRR